MIIEKPLKGPKLLRIESIGICAVLLASTMAATSVQAQDWTFQPSAELSAAYNDNIRLDNETMQSDEETKGGIIGVAARISRRSPTGSISVIPSISSSHYGSSSNADSDDYFLNALIDQGGQKSKWSLGVRFADEEVLSAELSDRDFDNPDVNTPISDDSGLVSVENRRTRFIVSPTVAFSISQNTDLELVGTFVDSSYDNDAGGLSDFVEILGGIAINRRLTDRDDLRIGIFGTRFDPDASPSESDSYGLGAQYTRRFSAATTGFATIGYEEVETDVAVLGVPTEVSEGAVLFGLGLTRRYETSRVIVKIDREISPSGLGDVLLRNQLRVKYSRDLSELFSLQFGARYQRSEGVTTSSADLDRDLYSGQVGLKRQLSRAWSITGQYVYTRQDFGVQGVEEKSNAAFLRLRYESPRPN